MDNKTILQQAIKKSIDGGWDMFKHAGQGKVPWHIVVGGEMPTPKVVESWVPIDSLLVCGIGMDHYYVWEHVIFNHDFAKALWGDEYNDIEKITAWERLHPAFGDPIRRWQYHLMKMVIADDPIKYLGENI